MALSKFITKSGVTAALAIAGLTLVQPVQSQQIECGNEEGNLCGKDCVRECESGGCCSWEHFYFPKNPE